LILDVSFNLVEVVFEPTIRLEVDKTLHLVPVDPQKL